MRSEGKIEKAIDWIMSKPKEMKLLDDEETKDDPVHQHFYCSSILTDNALG